MSNRKSNHTKEDYIEAAAKSTSLAGMCRHLGLIAAGGNYSTMHRKIAEYDLDVSHFLGQAHSRGKILNHAPNHKTSIKKVILKQRGHQCESCKNTEWLTLPITLELEHIDGDNTNNDYNNLLLLCPNCHSQTKTWRRAKSSFNKKPNPDLICQCGGVKQRTSKVCVECYRTAVKEKSQKPPHKRLYSKDYSKLCPCGEKINLRASQCSTCAHDKQKRIEWPAAEFLISRLKDTSFVAVARDLGVSDNAVRKYLRQQGFDPKTFGKL
ncbi:MAG: transposase family protein [Enterococcus sp.]|nr:transposase family protein [Enterococcus sp.]